MICANRMVCAFPDSWLVDGTRIRTSTPSLAAHPLLLYLAWIYAWFRGCWRSFERQQLGEGEALV